MSEPQDCLASVLLTSDSNVAPNKNQSCHDRVESICGNSTSVEILEEFRHIYEERLRKIDEETGGEGLELKLKTLTSWVNDLGEQNQMLVETVEQLEREAGGRVSLLEDRLRKSSHVALEYMSKLEEYDNQIWGLSEGKIVPMVLPFKTSNGMVQAQQTEEILKTRVTNLQNDISGLLELIRRARCEGSWDTNGIRFLEVTNEDIFGSNSHQISCDTLKSINFDGSTKPKINFGNHELDSPSWKQKSFLESEEIKGLTKKLEDVNSHLQTTLKENERLIKEIEFLSDELKSKTDRIAALSQNTSEMDKILKQTRKNLNEEIAEKHDQLVALQRCMSQLEKRVQEIDVQSYFKDAIIREMRKDMRLAQMKLTSQERSQMWCVHMNDKEIETDTNGGTSIPCPCPFQRNKFHVLLHQANQSCSVSKSAPVSCCPLRKDGNLFSKTPHTIEKKMGKNECMASNQLLRRPFHQTKINSLENISSKQGHTKPKKLREHIRVKTISDVYIPKESRKHLRLCEVGNKLAGRAWVNDRKCPIELFQNAGDDNLNILRTYTG